MACLFKRAIFGHAQAHSSNTGSGGGQSVGCGTSAENNANCGWETPGDGPADKTLQHVASVSHSRSGLCEKLHFLCFLLLSNSHAGKWVTFIFYHRNSKLTARLRRLSCVLPFLSTACSQNTGRLSTRSQDFTCFSRQKPSWQWGILCSLWLQPRIRNHFVGAGCRVEPRFLCDASVLTGSRILLDCWRFVCKMCLNNTAWTQILDMEKLVLQFCYAVLWCVCWFSFIQVIVQRPKLDLCE